MQIQNNTQDTREMIVQLFSWVGSNPTPLSQLPVSLTNRHFINVQHKRAIMLFFWERLHRRENRNESASIPSEYRRQTYRNRWVGIL